MEMEKVFGPLMLVLGILIGKNWDKIKAVVSDKVKK